jgi:hypothetical protein
MSHKLDLAEARDLVRQVKGHNMTLIRPYNITALPAVADTS